MIKDFDRLAAKYYEDPTALDCRSKWDRPKKLMSENASLWRHFTSGYRSELPDRGASGECVDRHCYRVRMLLRVGGHK